MMSMVRRISPGVRQRHKYERPNQFFRTFPRAPSVTQVALQSTAPIIGWINIQHERPNIWSRPYPMRPGLDIRHSPFDLTTKYWA